MTTLDDRRLIALLTADYYSEQIEIAAIKKEWWATRAQHYENKIRSREIRNSQTTMAFAEKRDLSNERKQIDLQLMSLSDEVAAREEAALTLSGIVSKFDVSPHYITQQFNYYRSRK